MSGAKDTNQGAAMPMTHTMGDACPACGEGGGCLLPLAERHGLLTLEQFWHVQGAWSQATFGLDGERGPAGPLAHLAKEVEEAKANPTDASEYADLVFLVFDTARRAGLTYRGLVKAVNDKLAVNKARTWGRPGADGVVEHVRGPVGP
jgi:hypothetical protein